MHFEEMNKETFMKGFNEALPATDYETNRCLTIKLRAIKYVKSLGYNFNIMELKSIIDKAYMEPMFADAVYIELISTNRIKQIDSIIN